jgi:hypothetical protein
MGEVKMRQEERLAFLIGSRSRVIWVIRHPRDNDRTSNQELRSGELRNSSRIVVHRRRIIRLGDKRPALATRCRALGRDRKARGIEHLGPDTYESTGNKSERKGRYDGFDEEADSPGLGSRTMFAVGPFVTSVTSPQVFRSPVSH